MKTQKQKRWIEYHLPVSDRRKMRYEYYVTGHGPFPIDMLRHDGAWPASGEDAAKIEWTFTDNGRLPTQSIRLRSHGIPTVDRWSSFNWSVGVDSLESRPALKLGNMVQDAVDESEAAEREFRPVRT